MVNTLRNAWKIPDLRKRLIFTLMMFFVIRLGAHIPVPGVNSSAIKNLLEQQGGALGLFDMISGGAFQNMTIFAMGIVPYINASIILQLLQIAIPKIEEIAKEGEEGRKKIAKWTRYLSVILAAVQAWGFTFALRSQGILINPNLWSWIIAIITFVAGTAFLMWVGEQITENGIGNGISLIIFINIVSRLPVGLNTLLSYKRYIATAILIVIFGLIIAFVVFMQQGERRVAVQYAKRTAGRKVYGGQSTHIPIKVNIAGVIPIIFAMSLIQFPEILTSFFVANPTGFWGTVLAWLRWTHPFGAVIYALLILFFTFFYSTITFNPIDVANNMKKSGGFVPGIRPGKPTSDYLNKVVTQITLVGALFLTFISLMPLGLQALFKMNVGFGGTSLLIVVGVALETVKQMEAQMLMRHYKGFLD